MRTGSLVVDKPRVRTGSLVVDRSRIRSGEGDIEVFYVPLHILVVVGLFVFDKELLNGCG